MNIIPFFTSTYSLHKSVLTLDKIKKEKSKLAGASSIIEICKNNEIEDVYLVDTRMSGYLEAYENCQEEGLNLRFGLELAVGEEKDKFHKVIIFIHNYQGYKDLLKINNKAFTEFNGVCSEKLLKEFWTDNLSLVIPFYDSYLHKNITELVNFVPRFSFTQPYYCWEDHELPIDQFIQKRLEQGDKKIIKTHRIYYETAADFDAYLVNRCIHKRATLEMPNIDGMGSKQFSLESWKELCAK